MAKAVIYKSVFTGVTVQYYMVVTVTWKQHESQGNEMIPGMPGMK
jgi:hypothetical protein